ncbi:hypothetical protein AXG93_4003s1390 [Marchantia polymorpha subsp. ruderalis]|uniref:Uncharacterized protein n=1 Tax=Marchantia polymorpha subsp. ruderalis TaxID=1480154 RepID=A0A176WBX7_MARPO|nr:hypothetical protein AXG93_4003s1390 [Marchantia polymorpha subsp. ruderalis]
MARLHAHTNSLHRAIGPRLARSLAATTRTTKTASASTAAAAAAPHSKLLRAADSLSSRIQEERTPPAEGEPAARLGTRRRDSGDSTAGWNTRHREPWLRGSASPRRARRNANRRVSTFATSTPAPGPADLKYDAKWKEGREGGREGDGGNVRRRHRDSQNIPHFALLRSLPYVILRSGLCRISSAAHGPESASGSTVPTSDMDYFRPNIPPDAFVLFRESARDLLRSVRTEARSAQLRAIFAVLGKSVSSRDGPVPGRACGSVTRRDIVLLSCPENLSRLDPVNGCRHGGETFDAHRLKQQQQQQQQLREV